MYDVSIQLTGVLPSEMQFINAILTFILSCLPLLALIALFAIPYLLASNRIRR